MRARAVRMIVSVVAVVCMLMGLPGAFFASASVWASEQRSLEVQSQLILRSIERRRAAGENNDAATLASLVADQAKSRGGELAYRIKIPDANLVTNGKNIPGHTMSAVASSPSGVSVQLTSSASGALSRIAWVCALFGSGMAISMLIGWLMARSLSRDLSAPLIYLAAQAEQIGSGGVRARVERSGIEEIDLVSEELARTGERMAGRLAAERQAAADASHQLRTPITALSMRLEEIELISSEEDVRAEARTCLEQVERMTNVVTELLDVSKRESGQTEAIHILEVFNTAREEWEDQFEAAGRSLVFLDEAERPILADAGKLGQVLATLIENSLRYGDGTTRVWAHAGSSKRGVVIEVSDEGEGIEESLAPDIFEKGVSGHGSTGIGLALAHDLAQAMGGRLELKNNKPPVFTVSVAAIPASLDPDRVMPEGPLMSMGRRSRRF
ncbi:histidine kinase [Schaalia meyeri]|uniref:Signal transduction histidine-protein kinase/phosphatase MprB n=1 Tax=Schaalia meyeri TaxID=52773 RepID=A0AAP9Y5Q3_9ACTO|nr:HAMP domain-containing sensor histidine kinase [Schaalia meyeri]AKU64581.1 histidine kinase [Schaalia meyeri]QQC43202.1 HAMP domain-containing histidine kinase [Schaalia meyeri]SDS05913.1 Signal transduction histidine kinase [Schaalia meyeri]